MFDLVKTTTQDGLILNGLYLKGDINKVAVIYIHGFEGDFFSHQFITTIAEEFRNQKFTFLSVQTRGTSQRSWFATKDGEGSYIGSHLETLDQARLDIDAWIAFLTNHGYSRVILAGHSLGTLKVVRYLYEGGMSDHVKKIILICPFDKNGQENLVTDGKWRSYVIKAKEMIDQGKGSEYIPVETDTPWEEVSMSYQTFYSWYFEDELGCMFDLYRRAYNFPILNKIRIPVHIIVGSRDEFFHRTNMDNPKEGLEILIKNLKFGTGRMIGNATHNFRGYEEILVEEIVEFCSI